MLNASINWDRIYRSALNFEIKDISSTKNLDIYEYSSRVSNILMQKSEESDQDWPFDITWLDQMTKLPTPHRLRKKFKIWLNHAGVRARAIYIFYLANQNHAFTRSFLVDLIGDAKPLPDLEYFLTNLLQLRYGSNQAPAIKDIFEGRIDPDKDPGAQLIRKLVSSEEEYKSALADPRVDFKAMGGWRNIVLGNHEADFQDFEQPWQDSDRYYDLGGGHHTPWLSDRFGLKITSLDIIKPDDYKDAKLRYIESRAGFNKRQAVIKDLEGAMLEEYANKLKETPYQHFDIMKDFLPFSQKTTIFSTGFLTSHMPAAAEHKARLLDLMGSNRKKIVIKQAKFSNLVGMLKCLDLVYRGGDLELITVCRPSGYPSKIRVAHLRWVNGDLVYENFKLGQNQVTGERAKKRKWFLFNGQTVGGKGKPLI